MIVDELVTVLGLEIKDDGLPAFRSSLTSTIGKFGAVVAGAISASAAISAFLNTAASTNASAKFARSIDIGFEALQRMEFAAKRMGIEAGTLDGVLAGLRSSARGAFFGENDAAADIFGKIGVSITDLDGKVKGAEQLLLDLADAVTNAQNPDQILSFVEALGLGPQFEQFLRLGSSGIRALGDEAEATGAIMSEETARAAERFQESIDSLGASLSTFLFEQGTPLLEWATDASQALLDFSRSPAFDELKTSLEGISSEIEGVIELNRRFFESLKFDVPDGVFSDLSLTGVAGFLAKRNPLVAAAIATPLAIADFQKFREGEEDTFFGSIPGGLKNKLVEQPLDLLEFLSSSLGDVLGPLARGAINPLGLPGDSPFGFPDPLSGPVRIDIQNENHFQGISDPREAVRLLEEIDADSLLDASRSRQIK